MPSGPGVEKVNIRVEQEFREVEKELIFPLIDPFWTLMLTFWTQGLEGPGTHFQLSFQLRAQRAQELLWGD